MADSTIGSLPSASDVLNNDLFVLEQNGEAKKLTGQKLASFIDRSFLSVSVTELPSTESPTASFNSITGSLVLGIPRGNGIVNISTDEQNRIVFTLEDGTVFAKSTVKGDTGKSAYQYAVENGYEGTEPEFAQMMLDLYNASVAEQERINNERTRNEHYRQLVNATNEQLEKFGALMNYADSKVVHTTLMLYRGGVRLFDTTLLL